MSSTIEELGKAFEAFKTHNDAKLVEIERTGAAAAATTAAVEKANADITALQDKLASERETLNKRQDELEDRLNQAATGKGANALTDAQAKVYAQWQTGIQNRITNPVEPGEVDVELVRNYKKSFNGYLQTGRVSNEMEVGSDPDGGYWVDADTNGRLVSFIYESSPIRGLAGQITITGDADEGELDLGEAGAGWVGEQESRPETGTPQVAEYRVPLREMYAMPQTTQRILDFANRDVGSWLEGKVRRKFSRLEATGFVSGTGPKQVRGFLTYTAGTPGATPATWPFIQQVPLGAASTLTADGILDLVYALKTDYLAGAVMGMRRDTERIIRQLKDGNGDYLWQMDFSELRGGRVAGLSVVEMADMPAVDTDALALVVAQFGEAYEIVDSPIGVRVLRDNVTTKGKVKFYTTRYVGGDVLNFEAIKIGKVAAS